MPALGRPGADRGVVADRGVFQIVHGLDDLDGKESVTLNSITSYHWGKSRFHGVSLIK